LITDSLPFEGTFYKGHSLPQKLNDIILRLRLVQMRSSCILHVIHVAGTKMKEVGIDGLSWGDFFEGMMTRASNPISFVPFHLGADIRTQGRLSMWVRSWWVDQEGNPWGDAPLITLQPSDWFSLAEVNGPRLWLPAPAAMTTITAWPTHSCRTFS
jgi:hypothetical protein